MSIPRLQSVNIGCSSAEFKGGLPAEIVSYYAEYHGQPEPKLVMSQQHGTKDAVVGTAVREGKPLL